MPDWKNKIVAHGEESPKDLMASPWNWRTHPRHQQEALKGAIADVGFIRSVTVNRTTGHVVDGHLRVELAIQEGQTSIPVEYVELTEEEEKEALLSLDPIAAMAGAETERVQELLKEVSSRQEGMQALLEKLKLESGLSRFSAEEEWEGMPEFEQEDKTAYQTLLVHFDNQVDVQAFANLVRQKITEKTKFIWYPEKERMDLKDTYFDED